MNVYVESNFILELALEQDQQGSCQAIVAFGEQQKIQLVLPVFAIAETYETVIRRAKQRERLTREIVQEVQQLSRSKSYKDRSHTLQTVTSLLARSIEEEQMRLNATLEAILRIAETIPLSHTILAEATRFQATLDLLPQDAIVYASILEHLQTTSEQSHCFLNRNSRDFDDPEIVDTLRAFQCKMMFHFDHGFSYIGSQIRDAQESPKR